MEIFKFQIFKLSRTARASNNPESFSVAIKLLVILISRKGVSIKKTSSVIVKVLLNIKKICLKKYTETVRFGILNFKYFFFLHIQVNH